jgi:hypothetical protein
MAEKNLSEDMVTQLEAVSAAWVEMAIRRLKESAAKNKVSFTGELINSINGSISDFDENGVGNILIAFNPSGRILDYRNKYNNSTTPPIDLLTKWVESIGLGRFKFVSGYKKGKAPATQSMTARRIAWGIAYYRFRSGPKRPRKWFAKLMYGPLLAQLIKAQIDVLGTSNLRILDILPENLENGKG